MSPNRATDVMVRRYGQVPARVMSPKTLTIHRRPRDDMAGGSNDSCCTSAVCWVRSPLSCEERTPRESFMSLPSTLLAKCASQGLDGGVEDHRSPLDASKSPRSERLGVALAIRNPESGVRGVAIPGKATLTAR